MDLEDGNIRPTHLFTLLLLFCHQLLTWLSLTSAMSPHEIK
jgi:hypothetical protein